MWHQYSLVEPFGEERGDLRAGIVASVIANSNRDPKRRPQPFTAQDFMPDYRRQESKYKPIRDPAEWAKFKAALRVQAGRRG